MKRVLWASATMLVLAAALLLVREVRRRAPARPAAPAPVAVVAPVTRSAVQPLELTPRQEQVVHRVAQQLVAAPPADHFAKLRRTDGKAIARRFLDDATAVRLDGAGKLTARDRFLAGRLARTLTPEQIDRGLASPDLERLRPEVVRQQQNLH